MIAAARLPVKRTHLFIKQLIEDTGILLVCPLGFAPCWMATTEVRRHWPCFHLCLTNIKVLEQLFSCSNKRTERIQKNIYTIQVPVFSEQSLPVLLSESTWHWENFACTLSEPRATITFTAARVLHYFWWSIARRLLCLNNVPLQSVKWVVHRFLMYIAA